MIRRLLAKFSRTTSSGAFVPEIDGLRFIAITAVIAFHLVEFVADKSPRPFDAAPQNDWLFRIAHTGHVGVQLFFVISGFVVAMPFAQRRLGGGPAVNLRSYFVRRVTRIEPPYFIALVFWLLAFGISSFGKSRWLLLLHHFPASAFYLHNFIFRNASVIIPQAWSLEIEVQFYIVAPLLALVFAIRRAEVRRALLVIAIITLVAVQPMLRVPGQINGIHLGEEGQYFLIGFLLLDLYLVHWRITPSKYPLLWDLLGAGGVVVLICMMIRDTTPTLSAPIPLALVFTAAFRGRILRAVLRNPWIFTFGGMCYSVYLYHGFFKVLGGRATLDWQIGHTFWLNYLFQCALLVPFIVVGTSVMFLLTEKPFMRRDWPARLARRLSMAWPRRR